jgi:hypothetical protein
MAIGVPLLKKFEKAIAVVRIGTDCSIGSGCDGTVMEL